MLACYVTPDELYATANVEAWIPRDIADASLRNATWAVADDLRKRGYDPGRMMPAKQLVGTGLYETVLKDDDFTGDAVAVSAASRFVIDVRNDGRASFTLEGSKDKEVWNPMLDMNGSVISLDVLGAGLYSEKFLESYGYYRLIGTVQEEIRFTAYLVDDSASRLIVWRAVMDGMYPALDGTTRTELLYSTARDEYREALGTLKAAYDASGDGMPDREITTQRSARLHR